MVTDDGRVRREDSEGLLAGEQALLLIVEFEEKWCVIRREQIA